MKYGTRGGIEWGDTRETICMWERESGEETGNWKIESMEIWKKKMGNIKNTNLEYIRKIGNMEVWKIGNGEILRKLELRKVWKIWFWKYKKCEW